jgi:hypothetical protein
LRRGLILVLPLVLAFGPTIDEDRPNHLLAGGVVRGDVQELTGGAPLLVAKLVNEGLAGGPREEHTYNVCVDDVRERIALLGEPVDVVVQELTDSCL